VNAVLTEALMILGALTIPLMPVASALVVHRAKDGRWL
jgi:hypothetical protein